MQNIRKILFPFSWLYGSIVWLRNKFFDWGLIASKSYDFPIICVGNISTGGTGKSPMIEYLISFLKEDYRLATLSRGYKRATSGYHLLGPSENATMVGDEPLQFKNKFPEIRVAVDENRQHGIASLRNCDPPPQIILLDDAFQHRKVKPGFSLLLTAYNALYPDDRILPSGDLREPKAGAKRANAIVVTKCPADLSQSKKREIVKKLSPDAGQPIFFSTIRYAPYASNGKSRIDLLDLPKFTLVTGIAKPSFLIAHLKKIGLDFETLCYPDHHRFNSSEIVSLSKKEFLLTTEKDFMRLKGKLPKEKLFYLPINIGFLEKEKEFQNQIIQFLSM